MADTPAEHTENEPTLGARLQAAREQCGLSLHQAAQDLHVSDDIIAALERDEYAVLGAPIFVRGHLRNYSHLLGLSADEVVAAYNHAGKRLAAPRVVTMKPSGNSRARRAGLQVSSLIVIAVLVFLAVIWWHHRAPALPSSVVVQGRTNRTALTPPAAETGQVAHVALPEPSTSVPVHSHAAGHRVTAPKPSVQATSTGGVSGPVVHAQFVVTQASWIEVYDASGKRLFYNLAPVGDKLNLSGTGPLQVFLGNAPGVSVELNGAPFSFGQYTQPNNTARFSLGASASHGGQPG